MVTEVLEFLRDELSKRGQWDFWWGIAGLVLPILFVGAAIGWFTSTILRTFQARKALADAKLAGHETLARHQDLLAKIEFRKEQVTDNSRQLNWLLAEFRDAIRDKTSAADLQKRRDEMCEFFSSQFQKDFDTYLIWCHLYLTSDERRRRARSELLPYLQTQLKFIELLNHPSVLEVLPKAARFTVLEEAVEDQFSRIRKMLPLLDRQRRRFTRDLEQAWKKQSRPGIEHIPLEKRTQSNVD